MSTETTAADAGQTTTQADATTTTATTTADAGQTTTHAEAQTTESASQQTTEQATTTATEQEKAAEKPVTYELTVPADAPFLDASDIAVVTELATAKGWTNEQAQAALVELGASLTAQRTAMREELDAHPEIGGTHFPAAQAQATRALDRFLPASTPEGAAFRAAMDKSGYGNYPPLVLMLARIGKAMGEDTPLATGAAGHSVAKRSLEERMFGDAAT
jgi:hypothetical protein